MKNNTQLTFNFKIITNEKLKNKNKHRFFVVHDIIKHIKFENYFDKEDFC